jgi:hypothetical protein
MGAAAVMGGAMENLLGNNTIVEGARRSSTPGPSTSNSFSVFNNFKSVIGAATKSSTQPTSATSSFYVSSPPVAPEPIAVDKHSPPPQKTVQGTVWMLCPASVVVFLFRLFFVLMKYCFN